MLKIRICDDTWTIKVLESLEELPDCSEGPRGLTITETKEIFLQKSEFTKGLVRHELFHAHHFYLFICSGVSREDREETLALWHEHRGDTFNAQVEHVYRQLKERLDDAQN